MALQGISSLLRHAVTYFGEPAVRELPPSAPIHFLDFSPLYGLVERAKNEWTSADQAAKAEVVRCAHEGRDVLGAGACPRSAVVAL